MGFVERVAKHRKERGRERKQAPEAACGGADGQRPPQEGVVVMQSRVSAEPAIIEQWYVERFITLSQTAFSDPKAYFHRYSQLSEEQARETALSIWRSINLRNLEENILPTRQRASLILNKGSEHRVETVWLRKL